MTAITSTGEENRTRWLTILLLTLGFWLSSCLLLDLVIMPTLFLSGMMKSSEFAMAGNLMFWVFNRLELLLASLTVVSAVVLTRRLHEFEKWGNLALFSALVLLGIVGIDTYVLTPQMSALGMQLNLFTPVPIPGEMTLLHQTYFVLEAVKIALVSFLFNRSYWRFHV